MSPSRSVAKAVAQAAADLDEAFECLVDDRPVAANVVPFQRAAKPTPTTLAECVPLLTVAVEFINRGPDALTIDGIEKYRTRAMELLGNVQPVIERRARLTLADWASDTLARPEIARALA